MLVLSWSRATFARFTLAQTLETFLRGHALAFEALDGRSSRRPVREALTDERERLQPARRFEWDHV